MLTALFGIGSAFVMMIVLGVLGWAVEKVAQHKATDIIEEIRLKEEDERRAG